MSVSKNEKTGLGWSLLALCMSLPWLAPVHLDPWPTFQSEAIAGLVAVPLAAWAVAARRTPMSLDRLAVAFLLVSAVPLLQAAYGMFAFPAEAYLISLFLVGFGMTVAVARRTEEMMPGRLADALFAGLVIASLVSVGLAFAQWLRLDTGPLLIQPPVAGRPVANVGQANELSTLLMWGLVGLWWAQVTRRIGGATALAAAALLLAGVVSTQSRTGWLAVGLLFMVAMAGPALLGSAKHRSGFAALALWFVVLTVAWPTFTLALGFGEANSLSDRLSVGPRREIWAMMIDGIRHQPWFGFGWNQGRMVQLGELPNYSDMKVGVQHAHNVVLDLMVWNGAPLGLALSALLAAWFWWQVRRIKTAAQMLLLLALSCFMLHALLELPHCKAFFLVPVALMMGMLNAQSGLPVVLRIPRIAGFVAVVLLAGAIAVTWVDYRRIEADLMSFRMRMARVGDLKVPPAPDIYVLNGLQSALLNLRIEPRAAMGDDLERLRITADRYPIETALFKYAKAAALNQQPAAAQQALSRWCLLFTSDRCDVARTAWDEFLKEHPEIARIPFPSVK
jgi:O-antigen ligase